MPKLGAAAPTVIDPVALRDNDLAPCPPGVAPHMASAQSAGGTRFPAIASLMLPLPDPQGASVIVTAVAWLQATLLGTLATTVAIIAVAAVGFQTLSGRLAVRRGLSAILGCFILFGASSIVAGIMNAVNQEPTPAPTTTIPPSPISLDPSANYDPYAGAAMPEGIVSRKQRPAQ